METVEEESGQRPPAWGEAVEQCRLLLAVLESMGLETLTPPELDGLAAEAAAAARRDRRYIAEAGLAAAGAPGGLIGPARLVVEKP